MLDIAYRDRKTNLWVIEKQRLNMSEDGNGPEQDTSAGYEITDGATPTGNLTKLKDLVKGRRDGGDMN